MHRRCVYAGRRWALPLHRPAEMAFCWGMAPQCDAPDGVFTGRYHSIGLREDGTITCWGRNDDGPVRCTRRCVYAGRKWHLPLHRSGRFGWGQTARASAMHQTVCSRRSRLATYHSIGIKEDGTIACWGLNNYGQCDSPNGEFTPKSRLAIWHSDSDSKMAASHAGARTLGNAMHQTVCLRRSRGASTQSDFRENGTIECWGADIYGQSMHRRCVYAGRHRVPLLAGQREIPRDTRCMLHRTTVGMCDQTPCCNRGSWLTWTRGHIGSE